MALQSPGRAGEVRQGRQPRDSVIPMSRSPGKGDTPGRAGRWRVPPLAGLSVRSRVPTTGWRRLANVFGPPGRARGTMPSVHCDPGSAMVVQPACGCWCDPYPERKRPGRNTGWTAGMGRRAVASIAATRRVRHCSPWMGNVRTRIRASSKMTIAPSSRSLAIVARFACRIRSRPAGDLWRQRKSRTEG